MGTWLSKMGSPEKINILYLTGHNRYYKKFNNYLNKSGIDYNLLVADNLFDLIGYGSYLDSCNIIFCDLFFNKILLEDAADVLDRAPQSAFIIGLTKSDTVPPELYETPSALRITDIYKISSGWKYIWNKIEETRAFIEAPVLTLHINEIPISELLEVIKDQKWTSLITVYDHTLSLSSKDIRGCIYFHEGQPETAWSTNNQGIPAIYDFLSLTDGVVKVFHISQGHIIKNLNKSIQEIMMTFYAKCDQYNKPIST